MCFLNSLKFLVFDCVSDATISVSGMVSDCCVYATVCECRSTTLATVSGDPRTQCRDSYNVADVRRQPANGGMTSALSLQCIVKGLIQYLPFPAHNQNLKSDCLRIDQ